MKLTRIRPTPRHAENDVFVQGLYAQAQKAVRRVRVRVRVRVSASAIGINLTYFVVD